MKSKIILFFLILISISSCINKAPKHCDDGWDVRMKIVNNTPTGIYIISSAAYPDTNSYNSISNDKVSFGFEYVNANSSNILSQLCSWDDYFRANVKSDTLMVFILLDEGQGGRLHLDLEKIMEKHTVLKRHDLTIQDLERMNWTITYP